MQFLFQYLLKIKELLKDYQNCIRIMVGSQMAPPQEKGQKEELFKILLLMNQ